MTPEMLRSLNLRGYARFPRALAWPGGCTGLRDVPTPIGAGLTRRRARFRGRASAHTPRTPERDIPARPRPRLRTLRYGVGFEASSSARAITSARVGEANWPDRDFERDFLDRFQRVNGNPLPNSGRKYFKGWPFFLELAAAFSMLGALHCLFVEKSITPRGSNVRMFE